MVICVGVFSQDPGIYMPSAMDTAEKTVVGDFPRCKRTIGCHTNDTSPESDLDHIGDTPPTYELG
jgi:hypothetical protein